jgi:DNA-binding response OmpR family regulator
MAVKPTILIVDDEPGVRTSLAECCVTRAYSVDAVAEREKLSRARDARRGCDLIVLDVCCRGWTVSRPSPA